MQIMRSLLKDTEPKLTECLEYPLIPRKSVPQGSILALMPSHPKSRGASRVKEKLLEEAPFPKLLTVSKKSSAVQILDSSLT